MANKDFFSSLFFIFHGHLEFFTNLVVATSTLVSFKYAPLVTVYLSILFQLIPIFFIIYFREKIGFTNKTLLALLFFYTFLPSMNEVVANSINLHFHFLLLAFLLVIVKPETKVQELFFLVLLFSCGISGVPANFMFPIFIIAYFLSKDLYFFKSLFVLLFTSLIQALLVFHFNDSASNGRVFSFDASLYLYATLTQSFLSVFTGDVAQLAAVVFLKNNVASLLLALGMILIVFYFYKSSLATRYEKLIALSSFVVITLASFTLSLGDKTQLVSYAGGGRYFFVPSMIVLIFFLISYEKLMHSHRSLQSRTSSERKTLWIWNLVFFVLVIVTLARLDHSFIGPNWLESYEKSQVAEEKVDIWPKGWQMNFHR
jgi:hypothetical protein